MKDVISTIKLTEKKIAKERDKLEHSLQLQQKEHSERIANVKIQCDRDVNEQYLLLLEKKRNELSDFESANKKMIESTFEIMEVNFNKKKNRAITLLLEEAENLYGNF